MSKFAVNKMRCAELVQVLVAVLCVWSSLGDGAVNYCGAKMCAHTDTHTFCQYPPGPDPSCVGYMDARLSGEEKARVLSRLNRRRSEVARGVRGLPPAGDMLKLRWVEELAREAQRWADQCQPPSTPEYYDGCRDLYSITVGQCVASVVGEAPGLRCESMADVWRMQSRLYAGLVTNYTPPENTNNYYGDFAQMVWSRAYMVGCGRSRFMTPWHGRLRSVERLVCNFAPRGPAPQRAMWTPGPPASACPARSHPDTEIPELCSYPETVRQLQEALDRMERKAASTPSTSGKVRRELRNLQHTDEQSLQNHDQKKYKILKGMKPGDLSEIERNKTIDRGPMLNMVLKYIPYLKPYEKSIIGDSNVNSGTVISPSFILFGVLYI